MNSLAETHNRTSLVRAAAVDALRDVYVFMRTLTEDSGLPEPAVLAHQLQVLMRGSIIAALEGNFEAVQAGRSAAKRLLEPQVGSTA
jgi:hypothetical protein